MDPSTQIVLSWLSTQVCPCGATGAFEPLLYDATCRVCKRVRECYGEGITRIEVTDAGRTETQDPPQWR